MRRCWRRAWGPPGRGDDLQCCVISGCCDKDAEPSFGSCYLVLVWTDSCRYCVREAGENVPSRWQSWITHDLYSSSMSPREKKEKIDSCYQSHGPVCLGLRTSEGRCEVGVLCARIFLVEPLDEFHQPAESPCTGSILRSTSDRHRFSSIVESFVSFGQR